MGLIRMMLVAVARVRELISDIDYRWAEQHAPEMAEHKLRALFSAKRARILAAARRLPRISAYTWVCVVCFTAAQIAVAARLIEVAA